MTAINENQRPCFVLVFIVVFTCFLRDLWAIARGCKLACGVSSEAFESFGGGPADGQQNGGPIRRELQPYPTLTQEEANPQRWSPSSTKHSRNPSRSVLIRLAPGSKMESDNRVL
jgi:hypothetical protein